MRRFEDRSAGGSQKAFFIASAAASAWIAVADVPPAQAADVASCHALKENFERLGCYDRETGYATHPPRPTVAEGTEQAVVAAPEPISRQWRFVEETSVLDGRKDVWLSVMSQNTHPNQIGQLERAQFYVRCMQNRTNVFVAFNDYTSDNQNVAYRIDDESPGKLWMETMADGSGIGIWSGSRAIPFAKSILGKSRLVVGYRSFSNMTLEFEFDVSGLEARIGPLAEACGWTP